MTDTPSEGLQTNDPPSVNTVPAVPGSSAELTSEQEHELVQEAGSSGDASATHRDPLDQHLDVKQEEDHKHEDELHDYHPDGDISDHHEGAGDIPDDALLLPPFIPPAGGLLPIFRGTNPGGPTFCAACKSTETSGCWRRGWLQAPGQWVNLCNKLSTMHPTGIPRARGH